MPMAGRRSTGDLEPSVMKVLVYLSKVEFEAPQASVSWNESDILRSESPPMPIQSHPAKRPLLPNRKLL